MDIRLHNTSAIVEIDGVPCRVWEGETGRGVRITAFIPRIAVEKGQDEAQFQAELVEKDPPRATEVWPIRMLS